VLPHLDAAYNIPRWLTRSDGGAEEVVQESCVRALHAMARFSGGNARAWLLTIVRHQGYVWLKLSRDDRFVGLDDASDLSADNQAHLAHCETPETFRRPDLAESTSSPISALGADSCAGRRSRYHDDQDREAWLAVLGRVCSRFNWRCHACCEMTNHYHFVVETWEANLSKGMRQLNGVYTQQVNRRHALVGDLFQGRFKAILVEHDAYLLELARYVVLNPVRAGMVSDASAWPWSSYRAMVGREPVPPWLETDWVLGQFGSERRSAQAGYTRFVGEGMGQGSIWGQLRHQVLLGSDGFIERFAPAARPADRLREVPRAQRRPLARPLSHYARIYPERREGHGARLPQRRLQHAGDRRPFWRALFHCEPRGALVGSVLIHEDAEMQDHNLSWGPAHTALNPEAAFEPPGTPGTPIAHRVCHILAAFTTPLSL
jgi:putative transposase